MQVSWCPVVCYWYDFLSQQAEEHSPGAVEFKSGERFGAGSWGNLAKLEPHNICTILLFWVVDCGLNAGSSSSNLQTLRQQNLDSSFIDAYDAAEVLVEPRSSYDSSADAPKWTPVGASDLNPMIHRCIPWNSFRHSAWTFLRLLFESAKHRGQHRRKPTRHWGPNPGGAESSSGPSHATTRRGHGKEGTFGALVVSSWGLLFLSFLESSACHFLMITFFYTFLFWCLICWFSFTFWLINICMFVAGSDVIFRLFIGWPAKQVFAFGWYCAHVCIVVEHATF